jgi:hypothetical protein
VDAHDLVRRYAQHAKGAIVTQVLLRGQRQSGEVVKRPDIGGFEAPLVKAAGVEGNLFVSQLECGFQSLHLELFQLASRQRFHLAVAHRCFSGSHNVPA